MMFVTMLTYGTLVLAMAVYNANRTSCTAMAQDLTLCLFPRPYNKHTWEKYHRGVLKYGGRV